MAVRLKIGSVALLLFDSVRIIFVNRADAYERLGGDTIQMRETARALREQGADVDEVLGPQSTETYAAYDLVHLFNLQTPAFTLAEAEKARAADRRIALSTIYWDFGADVLLAFSRKWQLVSKAFGRKTARTWAQRHNHRAAVERQDMAKILELADLWLPNSRAEIVHLLGLCQQVNQVSVVPNGIDVQRFDPSRDHPLPTWAQERGIGSKEYVLMVARIDEHKNQVAFCNALSQFHHPVVLAGGGDMDRIEECQRAGAIWVGPTDGEELLRSYHHARVHALPSFRETPGLASLEAAAMGCSVVSTHIGSVSEYFGDTIEYCDPESAASMLAATERAWNEVPLGLSEFVRSRYSWDSAGRRTMGAYQALMA